jgi:hypothetical protein
MLGVQAGARRHVEALGACSASRPRRGARRVLGVQARHIEALGVTSRRSALAIARTASATINIDFAAVSHAIIARWR